MTHTIHFDKDGNYMKTEKLIEADPYHSFKNNPDTNSVRINFYENEKKISTLNFYRDQFRV